jgi:prepilin-type N-terminal cleavage/methylation domain-containing protein
MKGYTLVEVLVALVILGILAVPVAYVLRTTGEGSARARLQDQALDLAQEAWTRSRAVDPPDSLRDTTWERSVSGARWRVVREVYDSSDRAAAGEAPVRGSASWKPPVEISVCALRAKGEDWDTVRCFRWMRPRLAVAP